MTRLIGSPEASLLPKSLLQASQLESWLPSLRDECFPLPVSNWQPLLFCTSCFFSRLTLSPLAALVHYIAFIFSCLLPHCSEGDTSLSSSILLFVCDLGQLSWDKAGQTSQVGRHNSLSHRQWISGPVPQSEMGPEKAPRSFRELGCPSYNRLWRL